MIEDVSRETNDALLIIRRYTFYGIPWLTLDLVSNKKCRLNAQHTKKAIRTSEDSQLVDEIPSNLMRFSGRQKIGSVQAVWNPVIWLQMSPPDFSLTALKLHYSLAHYLFLGLVHALRCHCQRIRVYVRWKYMLLLWAVRNKQTWSYIAEAYVLF